MRVPLAARIAAVGPGTAASLEPYGLRADVVPESFDAEHLACPSRCNGRSAWTCFIAASNNARTVLIDGLQAAGFAVDDCVAYYAVARDETLDVTTQH